MKTKERGRGVSSEGPQLGSRLGSGRLRNRAAGRRGSSF